MSEQTPLTAEQLAEIRARLAEGRRVADLADWPVEEYRAVKRQQRDTATLLAEAEEAVRLRSALVARERRDDELRAILARIEIPPGDAGADLWGLGMTVLSHMDSPIYLDDWDPEDRVGALRELIEKLTARVAELERSPSRADVLRAEANWLEEIATPIRGERSEHERGQMYAARRLRERAAEADDAGKVTAIGGITRAEVLNDAADRIAARAAQMDAVYLRVDQVCDALRRLGTEPAPVDDAERGGGRG